MQRSETIITRRARRMLGSAIMAGSLLVGGVVAKEQQAGPESPKEFLQGALDAAQLELQAGKLAREKAQHQSVKQLGNVIVEDHQEIRQKLKDLAEDYGVTPREGLQAEHQEQWAKLKDASGAEFDHAFVQHIIRDHQRDLATLDQCAEKFKDDRKLRTLIDQHTPTMRKHLKMARNAAAELGLRDEDLSASAEVNLNLDDNDRASEGPNDQSPGITRFSADDDPGFDAEFKKGDGEVLGLPTSNNDGTILGLVPAPSRTVKAGARESYIAEELADGKVDRGIENIRQADTDAVGAPPTLEREKAASKFVRENNLPQSVRQSLKEHGWKGQEVEFKQITLYEAEVNGKTVYVTEDGKIYISARESNK